MMNINVSATSKQKREKKDGEKTDTNNIYGIMIIKNIWITSDTLQLFKA